MAKEEIKILMGDIVGSAANMDVEIQQLKFQLEAKDKEIHDLRNEWHIKLNNQQARIATLTAALGKYGEHTEICPKHPDRLGTHHYSCTCGFEQALSGKAVK